VTPPRICLLVAHYPPSAESGARRPYNLAREFCRAGCEVAVIVAGEGATAPVIGDHGETVTYASQPIEASSNRVVRLWNRLLNRVRRMTLRQPDAASRFGASAMQTLAPLLAGGERILYVSAPPSSLAEIVVAEVRARFPSQVIVLEFRDPWSSPFAGPTLEPFRYRYEQHRIHVVRSVDAIVAVTPGIAQRMAEHGVRRAPVVAINGVPDELLGQDRGATRPADRTLRLLYLGEFYLQRDPSALLDALAVLRATEPEQTGVVQLDLVGEVHEAAGGRLVDLLATRGLGTAAVISDRVPYQQAKQLLADADVFLLLAQYQPHQVPNKLYEYLAYHRPIFAVVDEEGETAALLRQTGHGDTMVFPTSSPEAVADALRIAIVRAREDATVGDTDAIGALAASAQFAKVVELVREINAELVDNRGPA